MPRVIDPICSQCHVPGGLAQAAPFKVTPGNPAATAASAANEVDAADPTHSKLVEKPRGESMPSFPTLAPSDVTALQSWLHGLCTASGRPGSDLYAGNCSTCHGTTAHGGQNGLGVHGPDIQCTSAGDYSETVRFGDDGMPAFPALGTGDITAIVEYVHGAFCTGG